MRLPLWPDPAISKFAWHYPRWDRIDAWYARQIAQPLWRARRAWTDRRRAWRVTPAWRAAVAARGLVLGTWRRAVMVRRWGRQSWRVEWRVGRLALEHTGGGVPVRLCRGSSGRRQARRMGTTVAPLSLLHPRDDRDLPARLAESSAAYRGVHTMDEFNAWYLEQKQIHRVETQRVPFTALDGWSFAKDTGNLGHDSGGSYSIEGMRILAWMGPICEWHQPVVNQPGAGLHGLIVQQRQGILHCLVQAVIEPGHPETLELFPTVAVTRTDYARAHMAPPARYLDSFVGPGKGRVLADVLQSAAGQWCYRMSHRNMIVEVAGDVPEHEGFLWLTFGQLYALLHRGKMLSTGLRSLLSLLPANGRAASADPFIKALRASGDSSAGAVLPDAAVVSWLTEQRSYREVDVMPVALNQVAGWHATGMEIARADGRYFSVIGVAGGGDRELWSQPMIELRGLGLAAFVVKEFGGVLHVLARASMESGLRDSVEVGPTVYCQPKEFERDTSAARPFLLDWVMDADDDLFRYNVVHTGEGGVFFHGDCRYMIVEADESLPSELPSEYAWIALGQLAHLIQLGNRVTMPARTLYACLNSINQGATEDSR